ncbi:MAG: MucB/RseB C-terminal domain-containing protein [Pseudomonadales bacterium]
MRILIPLLILLASPSLLFAGQAGDESITVWLEKMRTALKEESYEGVFTYMRGHRFDTVRVVHQFKDGVEVERLVQLNGEQREVLREGDEIICRHEKTDHIDLEHDVPLGPFTHAFNENLSNYQAFYDFSLQGEDRIADHQAIKLSISPRHDDRYGYRLWLDKDTGLLLQSHLVSRGRILEVFRFAQVDIGEPIEPANLAGNLDDFIEHNLTAMEPEAPEMVARPEWRVSWLPSGFRQITTRGPNRILFSDGIATISVFIERSNNSQIDEAVTHMGGTVVLTRRLEGSAGQITVVGEVPVDTAKKVAASVEPVIY